MSCELKKLRPHFSRAADDVCREITSRFEGLSYRSNFPVELTLVSPAIVSVLNRQGASPCQEV
jgi:hypothetical protein